MGSPSSSVPPSSSIPPPQQVDYFDSLKANLSTVGFDHTEFVRILAAKEFPETAAKQWIDDHFALTLQISTLYVFVIFGTKWLMRNRQPFNLFVPLNAWNLFLAVFSIAGAVQLTPEFFSTLMNRGFQDSYCKVSTFTEGRNGYWVWLFIVSKMFELVDTVFLVLRKRPLLFLHWYHHILTMVYAFYSYPLSPGFNRWGIYLNYCVHAFMYSYYFLRSMKVRVPGSVAKFITTIQIWQFIVSVVILIHLGWLAFGQKVDCDINPRVYGFAVFMDMTYLVLFLNFFLNAYVFGGGKAKYQAPTKLTNGKAPHANGTDVHQQQNGNAANGKVSNGVSNGVTSNGCSNHHDDEGVRKRNHA